MEPAEPPNLGGRPPIYTRELADAILLRLADGESLRSICRDPAMPSRPTVYGWDLDDTDGFSARYARAREMQAHALADDLIEIADDGSNDWMRRNSPNNAGWEANGEHLQRSRLRYDARKWNAAKILPKVYGDKSAIEHSGRDGAPIEFTTIRRLIVDPKTTTGDDQTKD